MWSDLTRWRPGDRSLKSTRLPWGDDDDILSYHENTATGSFEMMAADDDCDRRRGSDVLG